MSLTQFPDFLLKFVHFITGKILHPWCSNIRTINNTELNIDITIVLTIYIYKLKLFIELKSITYAYTSFAYDRTHIRLCLTRYKIYRGQCPYPRSATRVTSACRVVHRLKDGTRTCTGCRSIRGWDDRNGAVQTRTIPHLNSIRTS